MASIPTSPRAATIDEHPFAKAFRTRDLEEWSSHFAADIKLFSPIFSSIFEGHEAAVELYDVLFAQLDHFEIAAAAHADGIDIFHWRCKASGRPIEGIDLIRYAPDHKIREIRVMIRTLPSLAAFALAAGPQLARRRGWLRGILAYALTYPLTGLFALVDVIAPRLVQRTTS